MIKARPSEPKKILTIEAIIIPNTPIIKKDPNADKFFFVVYPYIDNEANAAEVMKNTLITDSPV